MAGSRETLLHQRLFIENTSPLSRQCVCTVRVDNHSEMMFDCCFMIINSTDCDGSIIIVDLGKFSASSPEFYEIMFLLVVARLQLLFKIFSRITSTDQQFISHFSKL